MATGTEHRTPSWSVLFIAALLIAPAQFVVGVFLFNVVQTEAWKPIPDLRAVDADPPLPATGLVAYVGPAGEEASDHGRACVFVVPAAGTSAPRRLGCAGQDGFPRRVVHLSWSPTGDLVVQGPPTTEPVILPADGGRLAPDAMPGAKRGSGRVRADGTEVHLAEITHDKAQIAVTPLGGRPRTIATLDGSDHYQFGWPQWSPDGRWILFSDTAGRLLILSAEGGEIRELVPAGSARQWLEAPLLTWHQGGTP